MPQRLPSDDTAADRARAEAAAQGLPAVITDRSILARVARILRGGDPVGARPAAPASPHGAGPTAETAA